MADPMTPDWEALLDVADPPFTQPLEDHADEVLKLTREQRKAARDAARREWRG